MKSKVDPKTGKTLFAITKWVERPCEMHLCKNSANGHVSIGSFSGFFCGECRDDLTWKASQCPLCGKMVRHKDAPESAPDFCCSDCWDPNWTEEQKQEAGWA